MRATEIISMKDEEENRKVGATVIEDDENVEVVGSEREEEIKWMKS